MIRAGVLTTALLLAGLGGAPVAASTLDYSSNQYQLKGTASDETLSVEQSAGAITFRDSTGEIELDGVPEDCAAVEPGVVRCTTLPSSPPTIAGGDGNDVIIGSEADERLFGDQGDDIVRPGLGTDEMSGGCYAECEDGRPGGRDTLDFSQDGRTTGIRMHTMDGPDPDEYTPESYFSILIGTEFDDRVVFLGGRKSRRVIRTLGGDDFVNVDNGSNSKRRSDRVDCGAGEDLYRADPFDTLTSCEAPGIGPNRPAAGDLRVRDKIKFAARTLVVVGQARCAADGPACTLRVRLEGGGHTVTRVPAGEVAPLEHQLTPAEYERIQRPTRTGWRRVTVVLRKPGLAAIRESVLEDCCKT